MTDGIPDALRDQANDAFRNYERIFVERIAKNPRASMPDAANDLDRVLATGDEDAVRQYIADLRRRAAALHNSVVT